MQRYNTVPIDDDIDRRFCKIVGARPSYVAANGFMSSGTNCIVHVPHHSNSCGLDNAFLEDYFRDKVVPAKDERKKVIRTLNTDLETLFDFLHSADDRFSKDVIRVGSFYQGLKVERSDEFDFTLCLNYFKVDRDYTDSHPFSRTASSGKYYGFRLPFALERPPEDRFWRKAHTEPQTLPDGTKTRLHDEVNETRQVVRKSLPLEMPGVGYRSLAVGRRSMLMKFQDLTFPELSASPICSMDLIPFLVKKQLKLLLTEAQRVCPFKGKFSKSTTFHGPALTVKYDHPSDDISFPISIDISPAVRCTWSFERLGVKWPRQTSRWPPKDVVQLIRQKGVIFVAKRNFYWRLSFAECEKVLCKHCDSDGGCRKKVHRLMKYFHKKIWWPQRKPEISSFIVKNVWILEMERLPNEEDWKQDKLNVRLFGCIRSLLDYVYGFIHLSSPLPQYFNPADNLLGGKDKIQLQKEYEKILHFYRNTREYF